MVHDHPRVTILMPVYNGERFLEEAIASVFAQDFGDFELVIVNDGSTDRTASMLADWAAREPRIVLVQLEANSGIPVALNHGLAVARGEYIARHDADDVFVSGRLRAQIAALDADPNITLVSCRYHIIDADGRRVWTMSRVEPPEVTAYLLHFSNAIGGHGQVMFRRDLVRAIGGYNEVFGLSEDYDLWTRLARHGRLVVLPVIGMKHRLHDGRVSVTAAAVQRGRSMAITRGMLNRLLERELSEDELNAVTSVWRCESRPDSAAAGHRILAECFARFIAMNGNPHHRRRVRIITAGRWVTSAAHFVRRGEMREALQHLVYAARWHPLGLISGTAVVMRSIMRRLWRGRTLWAPTA
ncbi:MAG TPA: glycosyltransferase family A protein [Thermoanaerobaculia bacterium]|nr:glycosyltransferase family A protein [Thermoanaerobaculia bacterium]